MNNRRGKNRKITLELVYDIDNIREADKEARLGKLNHYGVRKFDEHKEENIQRIHDEIKSRTYHTSTPTLEERFCDKKNRVLCKVHYYDHVAHHALMRVIMPVLNKTYYYESAASIKGRGIHYLMKHVRKYIDLHSNRDLWYTQLDFKKMYPNINRQHLYDSVCKLFADDGIRYMLHDVIWAMGEKTGLSETHIGDGNHGVGTGLYTTQPLVNYYTGDMLRTLSKLPDVKIFAYCDNIVIIGTSAKAVWDAIKVALDYSANVLEQPLHTNIGVQKLTNDHPLDFIGYLFYTDHTFVRKETKYRFKEKVNKHKNEPELLEQTLASYKGWLMYCDGKHLWNTVTDMLKLSDINATILQTDTVGPDGKRIFNVSDVSMASLVNRTIILLDFETECKTKNGLRTFVKFQYPGGGLAKFCTGNSTIITTLESIRNSKEQGIDFPIETTVRCDISGNGTKIYRLE